MVRMVPIWAAGVSGSTSQSAPAVDHTGRSVGWNGLLPRMRNQERKEEEPMGTNTMTIPSVVPSSRRQ